MGASHWSYVVAYQPDLNAAFEALRNRVFADGDYWWSPDEVGRPPNLDELFDHERVQEDGTHSILDMDRVLAAGEGAQFGAVQPVTKAEALRCTGTELLTRKHLSTIKDLAERRWYGRCAILHDAQGQPEEICFWGFSGD